jgi:hypothetical protein
MPLSHPCEYGDAFRCSVKIGLRMTGPCELQHGKHRVVRWPTMARVEASATLGPGPSHVRDGEVDDSTLPK